MGIKIPSNVAKAASKAGVRSPMYIYEVANLPDKPVASIGGNRNSRFANQDNAKPHQVKLVEGWIAFMSPSSKNSKTGSKNW